MDRKEKILYSIINSYIRDGKPIGSRTIARKTNIDVSPATIRNDMSDLEELGFLEKTHVSSGRIPSEKAYRLYVNTLMELGVNKFDIPQLSNRSIEDTSNALDSLIDNASDLLADATNYAAVSLRPSMSEVRLKHFKTFYLNNHEFVLVYVYNNKAVKNNLVKIPRPFNENQLYFVEKILRSLIEGKKLKDLVDLLGDLNIDIGHNQYLLKEIKAIISRDIKKDSQIKYKIVGLSNLLHYDEFSDIKKFNKLTMDLNNESLLINNLIKDIDDDIEIYVGSEIENDEFKDLSIVLGKFVSSYGMIGKIGVIGPKRMEYAKVIRDIGLMTKYISSQARI